MARKDVLAYYLQQQGIYLRMVATAKKVDDDLKAGLITREERDRLSEALAPSIGQIRDNYERLSYIMLLLNEPKRKARKKAYMRQNEGLYKRLVAVGKENSIREDGDALAFIRREVREAEERASKEKASKGKEKGKGAGD